MAATRQPPTSASPPPVTGADYMDKLAAEVTALWDVSRLPLTVTNQTGNDFTCTVTPALTHGLVDGMGFFITPPNNTTGAVRVKIGTGSFVAVNDTKFAALANGAWAAGTKYEIVFDGASGRFVNLGAVSIVPTGVYLQSFTSSGTYTPTPGMRFCIATMVGGGGSGATGSSSNIGAGGAGAVVKYKFTAAQIGVSKAVTIGAGGVGVSANNANGNDGGATSLGALGSAAGGAKGITAGAGGAGGVASGGFLNISGAAGYGGGGEGGSTGLGLGFGGRGAGGSGTGYGAGGAGRANGTGTTGAGAPGFMLIEEFT